jgi:hypothetical protein
MQQYGGLLRNNRTKRHMTGCVTAAFKDSISVYNHGILYFSYKQLSYEKVLMF